MSIEGKNYNTSTIIHKILLLLLLRRYIIQTERAKDSGIRTPRQKSQVCLSYPQVNEWYQSPASNSTYRKMRERNHSQGACVIDAKDDERNVILVNVIIHREDERNCARCWVVLAVYCPLINRRWYIVPDMHMTCSSEDPFVRVAQSYVHRFASPLLFLSRSRMRASQSR